LTKRTMHPISVHPRKSRVPVLRAFQCDGRVSRHRKILKKSGVANCGAKWGGRFQPFTRRIIIANLLT
jgi:hypothetical protein